MGQESRTRSKDHYRHNEVKKGFKMIRTTIKSGYTYVLNGSSYTLDTNPKFKSTESIQDYIHKPGTSFEKDQPTNFLDYYASNPSFKKCSHRKVDWKIVPSTPESYVHSNDTYIGVFELDGYPAVSKSPYNLWQQPLIQLSSDSHDGKFVEPLSFQPDTSNDMTVLRGLLDDNRLLGVPDINLVQSIAELRDASKIVDLVRFHKLDDKAISGKYLGYQFGVLPLIGDFYKISDLIRKIKPAFDKWNDQAKQGVIRNAHATISETVTEGTFRDYNNGTTGTPKLYYTFECIADYKQVITRKAHVYYKPMPMDADDYDRLLKSLWGLNKPLSAAWELVPFSFMVDWVTNVGDLIQDFESSNPYAKLAIHSGGITTEIKTTIVVKPGVRWWGHGIPGFRPMGEVTYTFNDYQRDPVMPDVLSTLFEDKKYGPLEFTPSLSTNQAVLYSALVHQFLRK